MCTEVPGYFPFGPLVDMSKIEQPTTLFSYTKTLRYIVCSLVDEMKQFASLHFAALSMATLYCRHNKLPWKKPLKVKMLK